MNPDTAKSIAEAFMPAALGALESLTGVAYSSSASNAEEASTETLVGWCADYPVSMHAQIEGGGTVAMLWTQSSVAPVIAALSGEDPAQKTEVSAEDEPVLHELTGAVLGAGAAGLAPLIGSEVLLGDSGASAAQSPSNLQTSIGDAAIGVPVSYEGDGSAGKILLLYSADLESRIAEASAAAAGDEEEPTVSEDELNDILSGFGPDDETDHTGSGNGGPQNLDVVMDIELTATARLGMVEVPLSEVLSYGPGSIIEMGHLVDEPIELLVNGKLIARGDVVVVDEKFGLRITEIISPEKRIESIR